MKKRNPRERYALNNISAGSQRHVEDLRQYNDYYGPTQTYLREHPEDRIDFEDRSAERSIFENYENAPTLDSDKNWLRKAGEAVYDTTASVGNDILNSGRTWTGILIDQFINSDFGKIRDVEEEQEDLQMIQDYKNLHAQKNCKELILLTIMQPNKFITSNRK